MYTIGGVICHHGVLGQKWGKRNGPPYPLSASAHSAAEKKAGYKKSIKGGGRNEFEYRRKEQSIDVSKALRTISKIYNIENEVVNKTILKKSKYKFKDIRSAILDEIADEIDSKELEKVKKNGVIKDLKDQGIINTLVADVAAVYIAPIAILAVASAIEKGKMHADTKKAQKKLDDIRSERSGDIDKKTGFKLKSSNSTPEEDLKAVNPLHDNKTMAVNQNCVLCTAAYEMRRRGYDVNANLSEKPLPGMEMYEKTFSGSKGETIKSGSEKFLASTSRASNLKIDPNKAQEYRKAAMLASYGENKEHAKAVISEMSKQPNSRGGMSIVWGVGGGHMVAYEVKNGEFMIRDAQVGKTFKGDELEKLLSSTTIVNYIRLDDKTNFDVEAMRRMCS